MKWTRPICALQCQKIELGRPRNKDIQQLLLDHDVVLSPLSPQLLSLILLLNPRVNKMWFQGQPSHSWYKPQVVASLTSGREMERSWVMMLGTVVPPLPIWLWWMLWRKMRGTSHVWSLMLWVVSPPVLQSWLSVSDWLCVHVWECSCQGGWQGVCPLHFVSMKTRPLIFFVILHWRHLFVCDILYRVLRIKLSYIVPSYMNIVWVCILLLL